MNSVRLHELDAGRGAAMLLVCASHFLAVYMYVSSGTPDHVWIVEALIMLCRCATPTFIFVSGVMLGFQADVKGSQFTVFRLKLLDRALFLVSVGHMLVWLSLVTRFGPGGALTQGYITDTVAFCVMAGVFLVPGTRPRYRAFLGCLLYLASLPVWQFWNPEDPLLQTVERTMFGGAPFGDETDFSFPLVPWLGVYLVGSAVGGWLQRVGPHGIWRVGRRLLLFAALMLITAFVIKAGFLLGTYISGKALDIGVYRYVNPFQKHPPGPLYLFIFLGTSFAMLSVLFSQPQPSWLKSFRRVLETIGKNTLPVFIFQFFLYWTLFYLLLLNVPTMPVWIALGLLLLSLLLVWEFANVCQKYKVVRFLTMGIPVPPLPPRTGISSSW
jgi:uncharacterized membrane protein